MTHDVIVISLSGTNLKMVLWLISARIGYDKKIINIQKWIENDDVIMASHQVCHCRVIFYIPTQVSWRSEPDLHVFQKIAILMTSWRRHPNFTTECAYIYIYIYISLEGTLGRRFYIYIYIYNHRERTAKPQQK